MMLKDSFTDIGAYETLRKTRDIGYRAVEISQIELTNENVDQLDSAQSDLGINVASLSCAVGAAGGVNPNLETDLERVVEVAQRLGTRMLRIGMMPVNLMADVPGMVEYAKTCNTYAEQLRESGIDLYYHNHHIEFAKVKEAGNAHILDLIAENSPAMGLEIDVHWVARGGLDPVRTLHKYAGRTAMVHLKDYRIGTLSEAAFAALQEGDHATFMQEFAGVVQFAEVGEGNLDFASIIPAAIESGAEYLLVEQDQLYGRTVWEALTTSYTNLVALGHGDKF
ncbi:sugar phosphate isomerase/epimerase [Micrococcales bacterium 31B]|nr:sugar phosphate isomerase/epimerase [Micrococcales bacterium 31B]